MKQGPRLHFREMGGRVVSKEARWAEKVECCPEEQQLELGLQGQCEL